MCFSGLEIIEVLNKKDEIDIFLVLSNLVKFNCSLW